MTHRIRGRKGRSPGLSLLGALALPLAVAMPAQAEVRVLDFEDMVGDDVKLPDGYGGANWNNAFRTYDQAEAPFTAHSGTTAAYFNYTDGGMTAGRYYTRSITFDSDVLFLGAWFAGEATQPLPLQFQFYNDGQLLGSSALLFVNEIPQFLKGFGAAVDEIRLSGSAGRFVMDDFTFDTSPLAGAVPEPASWAMMILGFGAVGGMIRARARRTRPSRLLQDGTLPSRC
ncbi:MAG: PEPxxWA-CTERM sorting domain-containing protein [Sphingomonas bacterium]